MGLHAHPTPTAPAASLFGAIVAANQACDEIGIDTISAGNAIALTMELYERRLITAEDTDGIEARFGDGQALVGLVGLIGERRDVGDLLAEGMRHVACARPEWRRYICWTNTTRYAAGTRMACPRRKRCAGWAWMNSWMQANVRVRLKYLVTLRDRTGRGQEEVGFPPGATLQDVAGWLNQRYALSLPSPHIMATLNGRGWEQLPARLSTEIEEGDVICLFPPIAGG